MMAMARLPLDILHPKVVQSQIQFDAVHHKTLAITIPNLIFHPVISQI